MHSKEQDRVPALQLLTSLKCRLRDNKQINCEQTHYSQLKTMKGEVIDRGQCFTQGRLLQRAATEYRFSDGEVSMRRLGGKGLGRGTSKCRGNKKGQKLAVFACSREPRVAGG